MASLDSSASVGSLATWCTFVVRLQRPVGSFGSGFGTSARITYGDVLGPLVPVGSTPLPARKAGVSATLPLAASILAMDALIGSVLV